MKRKTFFVKTRYETLKVVTTCETVALQLVEIVMGKSHAPFYISIGEDFFNKLR